MKASWRYFFWLGFFTVAAVGAAFAFDICVHEDPMSLTISAYNGCNGHRCGYPDCPPYGDQNSADLSHWLGAIQNKDSALIWLKEMGTTILGVYYPDSCYHYLNNPALNGMTFMNYFYPRAAWRYLTSYDNQIFPADSTDDSNPSGEGWWQKYTQYGTIRTTRQLSRPSGQWVNVLQRSEATTAGTMWRTNWMIPMNGWDRYEFLANRLDNDAQWSDSTYMPVHFRIVCDVDMGTCDTNTVAGRRVATFYFVVKAEGWHNPATRWLLYPVRTITTRDFPDPSSFSTIDFVVDPHPGVNTFTCLDEDLNPIMINPNQPLTADWHRFGQGFDVNMWVQYEGCHTFYLYKAEVWDEGFHRLFHLPSGEQTTFNNALVAAFRDQWSILPGRQVGWYTDEEVAGKHVPFVQVNKLLQDGGLPTFFVNGTGFDKLTPHPNDLLMQEAVRKNVQFEDMMAMETYMFGLDRTCMPGNFTNFLSQDLWTDTTSDSPYFDVSPDNSCPQCYTDQNATYQRYTGQQSLQRSMDCMVWGYDYDPGPYRPRAYDFGTGLLLQQVQAAHSYGAPSWAMLEGAGQNMTPTDACDASCLNRDPTPNELTLSAWMAVGCDVDGLLWYPWLGGGLLEWDSSQAIDFCSQVHVRKSQGRYEAAKNVIQKIQRIAPVLEPMKFQKTFASKAFGRFYGTTWAYPPTSWDTVQQNVNFSCGGNPYTALVVDGIATWSPASGPLSSGGWSTVADSAPYVQVSHFADPNIDRNGLDKEDYWFLIVNRRALPGERRKIRMGVEVLPEHQNDAYRFDCMLAGTSCLADTHWFCGHPYGRNIDLVLNPGEAELVHFYRGDTLYIPDLACDTLWTPLYLSRNIKMGMNATLTIMPGPGDTTGAVFCWPDKTILLPDERDTLKVLGTRDHKIRFKAAMAGQTWKGINAYGSTRGNPGNVLIRNTEIGDAQMGLQLVGISNPLPTDTVTATIDSCTFVRCNRGLVLATNAYARVSHSTFSGNEQGISCTASSHLKLSSSHVERNGQLGVDLSSHSEGNFESSYISYNGRARTLDNCGIRLNSSSTARFHCCEIRYNFGPGVYSMSSTVVMADANGAQTWGHNYLSGNESVLLNSRQIYARPSSGLALDYGLNQISGSGEMKWIETPYSSGCQQWMRRNYWCSTDTADIKTHLPTGTIVSPVLTSWTACGGTTPDTAIGIDQRYFAIGLKGVDDQQYAVATTNFQKVVDSYSACQYGPGAIGGMLNSDLLQGIPGNSTTYFQSVADNSNISAVTTSAARNAQAWSMAYFGKTDSASIILQAQLDTAQSAETRVQAQIEMLNLQLVAKSQDTTDHVTAQYLTGILDSINCLIATLNKWTQYDITDSVVMYAPCTVDSAINIHQNAALVIKPYPGIRNPIVTFKGGADIWVQGFDWSFPRGKLIVQGEAGNPVTLHWDSAANWTNIESTCGYVDLKNAILEGRGWMNDNNNPTDNETRFPIFKADSCTFRNFYEGLWFWGRNDTSSYLRNSVLENMGAGGVNSLMGFGTALTNVEYSTMKVENCQIINGGGVGVFNYWFSDIDLSRTHIGGNKNYGILNWETGDLSLECSDVSINGDTTADVWVEDGTVNLVGSHTELSDTGGVVIYAADPSMVDLGDGENYLKLGDGTGYYLKSGDTTDTWDISLNTWAPYTPADTAFYSHLWPNNPAKWLVDTSLVNMPGCDQAGTMSFGGGSNFLIPGDDGNRGEDSYHPHGDPADVTATTLSANPLSTTNTISIASGKGPVVTAPVTKNPATAFKKATNHTEMLRAHHQETTQWREAKDAIRNGDKLTATRETMKFLTDHPGSKLAPAAMVSLSRLARKGDADLTVSRFLSAQAGTLIDPKQRVMAKRLSLVAKAQEGKPAEALAGLEEMMETAATPQDSIRALAAAMGVCFHNRHDQSVRPRNSQVRCSDVRELVHRTVQLAKILDNPALAAKGKSVAIPTKFALYQNYPNPFNPNTEIRFDLPEAVRVELKVFNILGQEVANLVDEVRPAGAYRVTWDSRSSYGTTVASGLYVYRIKAGNFTDAKKMMLIR
jgi:hypothetical protein